MPTPTTNAARATAPLPSADPIRDGRTGSFSAAYVAVEIDREIGRAERYGRPLALVALTLDVLPAYRARWGPGPADQAAVLAASLLRRSFRHCDLVGRDGGTGFVVLLPETDRNQAYVAALKTLTVLRAQALPYPLPVRATLRFSAGVAGYPDHGTRRTDLLAAAVRGRTQAQRRGGNGISMLATPTPGKESA